MKKIFFLIMLALGLSVSAQSIYQGVYSPLQTSPNDPDAEYQLIRRHYIATETDSYLNVRKELTIIRNRALTAYADKGESFIVWNPATQELKINECYTLTKDGRKVEMNPAGFVEQLPSECASCGPYNGIREMAIVHTGMEYGCTIVLDYTIHTLNHNVIEDYLVISQDCPVKKYEIIVDLSDGAKKNFKAVRPSSSNIAVPFSSYFVDDDHAGHYIFTNVGQKYQDVYLPKDDEVYPYFYISNAVEGEYNITEFEAVEDAQQMLDTYLDDNDLRYITAIRDYVVDHIGYNPLHPAMLDYQYMMPTATWQNNCGTAVDKAVLLAALLKQAGYNPYVVPGFSTKSKVTVCDPTATVVRFTLDSVEYAISPLSKDVIKPNGVAVEDVDTIIRSLNITEPTITPMAGRYSKLTLPAEGSFSLYPSLLAPSRKAPVALTPVYYDFSYTITLPEGVQMAGKPVNIKKKMGLLGEYEISISQEGNTLRVARRLLLPNCDVVYGAKEYKMLRKCMIDWYQYKEIILK